jgi:hypothetical protein
MYGAGVYELRVIDPIPNRSELHRKMNQISNQVDQMLQI